MQLTINSELSYFYLFALHQNTSKSTCGIVSLLHVNITLPDINYPCLENTIVNLL